MNLAVPSRRIGLCLLVSMLSAGCWMMSNDTVRVKIIFTDPNPAHRLTDVTVFSGGDKFSWPDIAAGEIETVTLGPGPTDNRQPILLYTLDGDRKSWDGPNVDMGKGYRIEIKIDAQGAVTHRHCYLPCSLD
jgi:hypothetical protein